jgi:hypothetical protein
MHSQPITLAELAAITRERLTHPSDRGSKQREMTRRKRAYANLLAKLENLLFLFEEGFPPEIVVRGPVYEVVMGVGDRAYEVEPILRDLLDEVLGKMEADIVALHLTIEREEQEALAHPSTEVDYALAVQQLCNITEELPLTSALASAPTSESVANARNPRTATTALGTGLGRAGSAADAA